MTMKTTYKVGDKVRILDAKKISYAVRDGFKTGGIYNVKRINTSGRPVIEHESGILAFWPGELQYIEKVEESDAKMTKEPKFKVGDKVRVTNAYASSHNTGDEGVIISITPQWGEIYYDVDVNGVEQGHYAEDIELATPKPTKNQRLTMLEKEVETLKAEMAALKSTLKPSVISGVGTLTISKECDIENIASKLAEAIEGRKPKSANEQRKAIIDEAKAFLEEVEREQNDSKVQDKGNETHRQFLTKTEYIVNAEKRTVVAIIRTKYRETILNKASAKCAPDDVFNADIGKAIALGRALGLDVSKFEQAVQPSEVVVGQVVKNTEHSWWGAGTVKEIEKPCELRGYRVSEDNSYNYLKTAIILNDTEAQY